MRIVEVEREKFSTSTQCRLKKGVRFEIVGGGVRADLTAYTVSVFQA